VLFGFRKSAGQKGTMEVEEAVAVRLPRSNVSASRYQLQIPSNISSLLIFLIGCLGGSVVDHFDNLEQHRHQIKIRIRIKVIKARILISILIRIRAKNRIRIRMTSRIRIRINVM
jgi:hypothetical protein